MRLSQLVTLIILLALHSISPAQEVIADGDWRTATDVVSFQPFAQAYGPINYGEDTKVTLTDLNTNIHAWYLLTVQTPKGFSGLFNLENPWPLQQSLALNEGGQLVVRTGTKSQVCDILDGLGESELAAAISTDKVRRDPYMPLCSGRLYLRNRTTGRQESATWVNSLPDVFATRAQTMRESVADRAPVAPLAARVAKPTLIAGNGNDIALAEPSKGGMNAGEWYQAKNYPGVYVSVMKLALVDPEVLKTYAKIIPAVGADGGLVNSVALDLGLYKFGWTSGTEHPGVGWSSRARVPHKDPGPDGFATLSPLVLPGVVNPVDAARAVGVFTGGFQRHHSAFRSPPYTSINRGSHYGFMEKGVVMSTLVPNLASILIAADGSLDIKTWTLADIARLPTLRDVRQNGIPIIDTDPLTGEGFPRKEVGSWGGGNWSGSGDHPPRLKTPRTSACLVRNGDHRFLVISYFSSHTPTEMARVLQAYRCEYAIHLDMNSPLFSYMSLFTTAPDGSFDVEHLSTSMAGEDVKVNGKRAPRWLLTPTYKDFFYILKR